MSIEIFDCLKRERDICVRVINCPSDYQVFQSDLDNLYSWRSTKSNGLQCEKNVNWCVSPRRKCPQFHADLQLGNNTLEETSKFRDLGLVTTSKLSWNAHVDKISSKANKILGLIKRTCRGLNDATTLRTLYCALVRSHLDYCTVVWSPRCVDKLERIQRRAIPSLYWRQMTSMILEEKDWTCYRFLFDVLLFFFFIKF